MSHKTCALARATVSPSIILTAPFYVLTCSLFASYLNASTPRAAAADFFLPPTALPSSRVTYKPNPDTRLECSFLQTHSVHESIAQRLKIRSLPLSSARRPQSTH
ncbi:hypothetical protein MAPG_00638 [Magnaporthiopsis poae ATCC 64411]|uniref:Uncharacterized protein n=1 Tax=Magnaporthiopsis poae (strain ATCC 64411 / 73-15) TaxID=644358 RepID=A0A0C4DLJ4_MAGP6|nr:hypothetical protein MAPG_00638 [Magnaporthiopsis poae ATCC 64411]